VLAVKMRKYVSTELYRLSFLFGEHLFIFMEAYRSGHNGPDSKSGSPQGLVGSNPTASASRLSLHAIHAPHMMGSVLLCALLCLHLF
jgi:hypothetical protein